MKVVCIADTHGLTPELPDGDVLVHGGDFSMMGTKEEIEKFDEYLGSIKDRYSYILATPGNHDFYFEHHLELKNAAVLVNQGVEIDGVYFWMSPYAPIFGNWAFMKSETELANMWKEIPEYTDILVTHGPAFGVLDKTIRGEHVGSYTLKSAILRLKPRYHVCGHIHESAGRAKIGDTRCVNASFVDLYYHKRSNGPEIFYL